MDIQKQKTFIIKFAYFFIIGGIIFILLKYGLPLLMPFVIGFFISLILKPIINFIVSTTKLKRSVVSVIILIIFYGVFFILISLFGAKIFIFVKENFNNLPEIYSNAIEPAFNKVVIWLQGTIPQIDTSLSSGFENLNDSIFSAIKSMSSTVVRAVVGIAGRVPSFLIRFLFTIISSFFFTIDYHRITEFVLRQFSEKNKSMLLNIKKNGVDTVLKFIRAYAILMTITFLELSIGLSILKIPNSILFAAVIAIIDILPILGTGGILLPWAAIALIIGNPGLSIGLVILYIIILLIRQVLEPKIVGEHIGLHPLVTLMSMFVGAQLFGFIGLFLLPIIITILKNMNDENAIHIFK